MGLNLTSPSIAVEHGHINVRGAGVSQQAVIHGRALPGCHVVSEKQEAKGSQRQEPGSAHVLPWHPESGSPGAVVPT